MAELGNKELSGRGIEAAIAVHAALGPGLLESGCENALAVEFAARGIRFKKQKIVTMPLIIKRIGPGNF